MSCSIKDTSCRYRASCAMKLAGIESIAASTERACKAKKRAMPEPTGRITTSRPPSSPCFVKRSRSRESGPLPILKTPTFLPFSPPTNPIPNRANLRAWGESVQRPPVRAKEQPDRRPSKRRQQSRTALRGKIHIATNERLYSYSRRHHDQVDIETLLTVETSVLGDRKRRSSRSDSRNRRMNFFELLRLG